MSGSENSDDDIQIIPSPNEINGRKTNVHSHTNTYESDDDIEIISDNQDKSNDSTKIYISEVQISNIHPVSYDFKKELVMKGCLKLKQGAERFKKSKKKMDFKQMDISIKKDTDTVRKTKAEKSFEQRQRQTQFDRLSKKAEISHRERVEKFNKQMEELTEFNDIPKVNWCK